jgi:hypothetical protein
MRAPLAVAFVAATLAAAHAIDPYRWAVVAAAAVLRFRVVEVAVLSPPRRRGWHVAGIAVRLGPLPAGSAGWMLACRRTQPARWVLFALSGPLANLGLAAAT